MADDFTVRIGSDGDADKLRRRLADMGPVLRYAGSFMLAASHKAFDAQEYGGINWPARYPRHNPPFLNIAPVVFRAGFGQKPGADDFRDRPALRGPGDPIFRGLNWRVTGPTTVELGHPDRWAGLFQFGGVGRIAITETTRKTLAEWLHSGSGKEKRGRVSFGKGAKKTSPGLYSEFARKLSFVWTKNELVQRTYARPFLGMTTQIWDEINEAIARHLGASRTNDGSPLPPLPGGAT